MLAAILASAAHFPGNFAAASVTLREGVVISPDAARAYVMSEDGGVASVRLADGATTWVNASVRKPVLVKGDRLLAQTDSADPRVLTLATLDVTTGASTAQFSATMPRGVEALARDALGKSFRLRAKPDGRVTWRWAEGPRGGADLDGDRDVQTGVVRLDPALSSAHAVADLSPSPTQFRRLVRKPLSSLDGRQFYSEDKRHVLASSPLGELGGRYRWTVADAAGDIVGTVDADHSFLPFIVVGRQLLVVSPARSSAGEGSGFDDRPAELLALDLENAVVTWTHPLAEVRYRGVLPP